MIIHKNLRLCGGTFFFLLLKANASSEASQDLRFKYFLNVVDPDAVKDLMDGEVDKLHTYASNFRNGREVPQKGKYIRLGNSQVCSIFKDEMAADKMAALTRVKKYVDDFVPERSRLWLVRALLELIQLDESIPDNKMFYTKPEFMPTYKNELMSGESEISFYDFLLGIWFYVYENCDDNSIGERTIKNLSTEVKANVESEFSSSSIGVSEQFQGVKVSFDFGMLEDDEEEDAVHQIVFMEGDDIAPDLGTFNPESDLLFVSAKQVNNTIKGKFARYIGASYKKHSMKRTFIYDVERPFKEFYVCSDLALRTGYHQRVTDLFAGTGSIDWVRAVNNKFTIQNARICDFKDLKNVIVGQGGLGKTMMVNHLFLTTIDDYERDGYMPIFTSLSDYIPNSKDLLFLICQAVTRYDPQLQLSDVIKKLEEGDNVLLLDGMDEIKKEYFQEFIRELDYLCDLYQDNAFIISTRNIPEIRNLNGFQPYDLQPLREEQAFEMIKKLDPLYIDDMIKERFINDVKTRRFRFSENEKKDFFGNPLFLTIMLISYSQTNNIPTQRYLFYEQAYRAMATRHDGLKGITRNFFTGLNEREFQKVFGQFCADSYADYQLKFERSLLDKYLQKVIDDNNLDTTVDLFFKDITEKLCLMYLDGTEYRFIHRSFQEYFAAYYFTTLMDEEYKDIYDVLMYLDEKILSDETIPMLFGLDNKKFSKYITIPFLETLFVSGDDREDYKDFLLRFYPEIEYVTGELEDDMADNRLHSALYSFISQHYHIRRMIYGTDFNDDEDWADTTILYYNVEDYRYDYEYGDYSFVEEGELYKYTDEYGDPYENVKIKEAGYLCSVCVKDALNDGRSEFITNRVFPLREEYDDVKKLYNDLVAEYSVKPSKKKRFGLGN